MGLRIVARLYDRSEALVMSSCLDAAGVPHWVFGTELININPFHEIAYEGYRIVVSDDELEATLAVIAEARSNPLLEGERLSKQHIIVPHLLLTLLLGWVWVWAFPLRRYIWHSV
jgi:hypothetical protein